MLSLACCFWTEWETVKAEMPLFISPSHKHVHETRLDQLSQLGLTELHRLMGNKCLFLDVAGILWAFSRDHS